MSIVLKNRILGYHYTNASKQDKQIFLVLQISETEGYIVNVIFPKCAIYYVFLFRNPEDEKIYISGKAAKNLQDAMDQPFFSSREPLIAITTIDPELRSINFVTLDSEDQEFSDNLFDSNCVPTKAENLFEEAIRQAVIDGNASTNYQIFGVDAIIAGKLSQELIDSIIDRAKESSKIVIIVNQTKIIVAPLIPEQLSALLINELKNGSTIFATLYPYGQ